VQKAVETVLQQIASVCTGLLHKKVFLSSLNEIMMAAVESFNSAMIGAIEAIDRVKRAPGSMRGAPLLRLPENLFATSAI
jgi:hypothetical protein